LDTTQSVGPEEFVSFKPGDEVLLKPTPAVLSRRSHAFGGDTAGLAESFTLPITLEMLNLRNSCRPARRGLSFPDPFLKLIDDLGGHPPWRSPEILSRIETSN
jgi:hypothetical protein